jgi:hypothetical protein
MARLLTIVNERKKLRNEYRKYLEDQYIEKKKGEEKEELLKKIEEMREQGLKPPKTEEDIKEMIK